ncbi:MAG: GDSL-type esterase/lipase family protein [Pseudomonadota bacterium]
MLPATVTGAAETKRFSFVTNVRVYENEPVRPDQSGTSKGIPGLDVYFRGTTPKMTAICFKAEPRPLMVWLAGDSTVTDQEAKPFAGWGQHLPQHFVSPVSVANYADSGESSASFLGSPKLWGAIKAGMKAGDWVLIQLGHNDKNVTMSAFQSNLTRMLTDAKAASVNAILVTPIARGPGTGNQHVSSAGANLPQIIHDLGKSQNVPVIDLTATTAAWMQTIRWQDYYVSGDATHTNALGADVYAGFVHDAIKAQVSELAKYLRP